MKLSRRQVTGALLGTTMMTAIPARWPPRQPPQHYHHRAR
jgi:hypothetical protein